PSAQRPFQSRSPSHGLPDDSHFGDQLEAEAFVHGVARVLDQRLDVRSTRLSLRVDDEIRVFLRDSSAADLMALEPAGLDEARRVVAGRVAEYRAGIRKLERLLRDALREQLLDARSGAFRVTRVKTEPSCEKPFVLA